MSVVGERRVSPVGQGAPGTPARRHTPGRWGNVLAGAVVVNLVVLPLALFQARDAVERGTVSRQDAASAHELHGHGEDVLVQLLDAETGQRGYLLTGDPMHLEPYHTALAGLAESTEALSGAAGSPEQAARATEIARLAEAKLIELGRGVAAHDAPVEARELPDTEAGQALMQAIRQEIEELLEEADRQADESAVVADREQRLARTIAVLTSIFVTGNLITMLLLLRQRARWERQREYLVHELEDLAVRDPLTGVLNRRTLEDRVHAAVARALAGSSDVGVHYIDLNGFKPVNDLLGHDTGDAVLTTVARRLQSALREGDAVSRVGGDEFVVVMEAFPDGQAAEALMQRLVDATTVSMAAPGLSGVPGDDFTLVVTASIGLATLRQEPLFLAGSRDAVVLASRLLAAADADMYARKVRRRPAHEQGTRSEPSSDRRTR